MQPLLPLRRPLPLLLALLSSSSLALGCSATIQAGEDPDNGTGEDPGAGADGGAAASCDEVRPIEVQEALPPDLLLVVDKSGSMDEQISGQQKWNTMRGALNSTLSDNTNTINFGLMLYPSDEVCGAGNVNTAVTAGSASAVSGALSAVSPVGGTPTHTSLQNALSYFQSNPSNATGRYVLLATDGEPNCLIVDDPTVPSVNESVAAIAALKAAGIPTYVLGFGNGVNSQTLQAMAQAGGQNQFYAANSPAELAAALDVITDELALPDCSFSLGETPDDPTRLRVFFDGVEVSRSSQHIDGWDYDEASNAVTIYGDSCNTLQSGGVNELKVDYGCQGASID